MKKRKKKEKIANKVKKPKKLDIKEIEKIIKELGTDISKIPDVPRPGPCGGCDLIMRPDLSKTRLGKKIK